MIEAARPSPVAYKTAHGQPIVYPRDDLNFAESFLYMMFALPTCPYALDPVAARCLEVILMVGEGSGCTTKYKTLALSCYECLLACLA